MYLVDRPVREKNALLQKLPRQPLRIKKRNIKAFISTLRIKITSNNTSKKKQRIYPVDRPVREKNALL